MNTSRRTFAKMPVGMLPASQALAAAGTWDLRWREERQKLAHRHRRLIYNDDADELFSPMPAKDAAEFLARRFDWTKQTQVDSYYWNIGDGQDPPWGKPDPEGVGDATRVMLEAARAAGQEAVISVRMNDIHDAFGQVTYPFKLQHRDLLLDPSGACGKYIMTDWRFWYWSGMDYSRPEVREHKFAYLAQISEKYLPDGVELDFMRHPKFFKPGEEAANLPAMTDFVRKIRTKLEEIGKKNGRPILLAARLADTPELSVKMGLDGPTWLREGLLDVLIIGTGLAPHNDDWKEFATIAKKYDVPAYPEYDCALVSHMPKIELMRGVAMNYWTEGAPGIYLFNPFVPPDSKRLSPEVMYGEFKRLGSSATLRGLDKVYCPNYFSPSVDPNEFVWTYGVTADRPLPAKIATPGKTFSVLVAENLAAVPTGKQCTLSLRLLVADKPEIAAKLAVQLNGKKLGNGKTAMDPTGGRTGTELPDAIRKRLTSASWVRFEVTPHDLRRGMNQVAVAYPEGETVVRLIQLWVVYSPA